MRPSHFIRAFAAAFWLAHLFIAAAPVTQAAPKFSEKPKIRALTAFVSLDRSRYREQISDALAELHKLKAAFEQAGYEVQTLRISTQPFFRYTQGLSDEQTLAFFREYDSLAVKEGFDASIGPALLADTDDAHQAELLAKILASSKTLEGTVVVAGDDGIHWKAIHAAAGVMKYLEDHTAHSQGNFSFAATALVPPGTPFYPASYYAGSGHEFALGMQSANVIAEALAATAHNASAAQQAIEDALGPHASAVEAVAQREAAATSWNYLGLDLSPAPLKEVSIGAAIENFTGQPLGSSGTLTAAALITRALRALPVKRIGYSGLMLPVLEDSRIAKRWDEGRLSLDALLAYSSVCGTGIDVAPLPGDVTQDQLARIIGDMASLAVKLQKPLSVRLLPVAGKKAGDKTELADPFLVNATIRPLP
ncbi:MAG: DUF711 family protein [Candidatus Acidiferrales bacterium]